MRYLKPEYDQGSSGLEVAVQEVMSTQGLPSSHCLASKCFEVPEGCKLIAV